jgi:hypothetical protein
VVGPAIQLNPGFSLLHGWLAAPLAKLGRIEEAVLRARVCWPSPRLQHQPLLGLLLLVDSRWMLIKAITARTSIVPSASPCGADEERPERDLAPRHQ